jgi:dephospho-CoA kinase
MHTPLRIAITGGIGSGKSHVCRFLEEMGYPVFYCDDQAKHIIRIDAELQSQLSALVGQDLFAGGVLNKGMLAAFLCQGPDYSKQVDRLVHPRVAKAFAEWTERQSGDIVFMECALLFESGFESLVDRTICVVVSESLRVQRVMHRDNVTQEKVYEWMSLQMPEEEKARLSDIIIHNNPCDNVFEQLTQILQTLQL